MQKRTIITIVYNFHDIKGSQHFHGCKLTRVYLKHFPFANFAHKFLHKLMNWCSLDDIVTILTFVNNDPNAWDIESRDIPRGIFQQVKWANNFKNQINHYHYHESWIRPNLFGGYKRSTVRRPPRPSSLQMDVMLNGKDDAIHESEFDQINNRRYYGSNTQQYTESFFKKAKMIGRWEKLIVDFFKGIPRKYETKEGKYDTPDYESSYKHCYYRYHYHGIEDRSSLIIESTLRMVLNKPSKQELNVYDGERLMQTEDKEIVDELANYLMDDRVMINISKDRINSAKRKYNNVYKNGLYQILRELRNCDVHKILLAAKLQKDGYLKLVSGYAKRYRVNYVPDDVLSIIVKYFHSLVNL